MVISIYWVLTPGGKMEAIILGLSTGSYCLLSCAPVTLPVLFSEESNVNSNTQRVTMFLGGRFLGYVLFGLFFGIGANIVKGFTPEANQWIISVCANILIGSLLIFNGVKLSRESKKNCPMEKRVNLTSNIFLMGLLTGINVCPPFIAACTKALSGAGLGYGVLYFVLFFVGTSIFFLPLYGVHFLNKIIHKIKDVARITMIILGIYYLTIHGVLVAVSNIYINQI